MESPEPEEIFHLCRLCLANNQVNVPIFGEQSDIRQTSLKISSCLPVKIAADDLLPKSICECCSDKLELLYTFWNSSQEAEKKLQAWVQKIDINNASKTISAVEKQIASPEVIAMLAEVKEETEDCHDKITISSDDDEDVNEKDSEEAPPPKRARRSPTVKEEISISHEYDVDEPEPFKVENEFDVSNAEEDEPQFVDLHGTSIYEPQPGPSEADAPFFVKENIEIVEDILYNMVKQEKEDGNALVEQTGKQKKWMKCDYCHKTYTTKSRIIIHEASHTGEQVYQCDLCPKIYSLSQPKSFEIHYYRNHTTQGIFNCETCNKVFYKKILFERHKKIHAPREKFVCEYCGKNFLSKRMMKLHILRDIKKKEYKCKFCSANFAHACLLTVHLNTETHANQKKYLCKICGKEYFLRTSFLYHMGSHKGKLTCEICGNQYSNKLKLDEHKNTHSKEVEYRCEICGKTFLLLNSFRNHSNKHQGAETVECEGCHKKFSQKILLDIHVMKYCKKYEETLLARIYKNQ